MANDILKSIIFVGLFYFLMGNWSYFRIDLLAALLFFGISILVKPLKNDTWKRYLLSHATYFLGFLAFTYLIDLGTDVSSWWVNQFGLVFIQGLIILCGFIFSVYQGSRLIDLSLQSFQVEIKDAKPDGDRLEGLHNGGSMIGMLERSLIFIFILLGQYAAIGFLIAAKSILRFGEVKENRNRMDAEYIIIGTLTSFLFVLLVGLVVVFFLKRF